MASSTPLTPLAIRDRDQYGVGLAQIRRQRRLEWLLQLGFIPAGLGSSIVLRAIIPSDPVFYSLVIAFNGAWMGMMVVTALRVGATRCPRCGEHFHIGRWWSNPWTSRCMSCRLHLRADEGAV